MKLYPEYVNLVNFYEKNPDAKPITQENLIPVCDLPDIFEKFDIPCKNKILAIGSKHIYTMQLEKGYYGESRDTHYHNLKKDIMLLLPSLIEDPNYVFFDNSDFGKTVSEAPATLVFILDKTLDKEIEDEDGNKTKQTETLVAYINEPLNPNEKTTILMTSYPRAEIEKYIERLMRNNRLLYLKEKMLHTQDNTGMQLTNATTMPFTGAISNLHEYKKNVNKKRMMSNGLYLKDIPMSERTDEICRLAIENNPLAFEYIPYQKITPRLINDLIRQGNKASFKYIPSEMFLDGFHYYLRKTNKNKKRPDIIYNYILNLSTKKQQTLLYEAINPNKEPSMQEAENYIVEHSNNNIKPHIVKEPGINVKNISDQILSFENKKTSILDIIGQRFVTDKEGKLSMESFKAISRAMEIYSDKHYETARYLFVKDGQILRHITVTSQTPSATAIKPDDNFLYKCRQYAIQNDAQIVFLHNHPSGFVEPSQEDKELTQYLSNFFTETDERGNVYKSYFSGHIILDHGTYGLYTDKTGWKALIDDNLFPIEEAGNRFKLQLTSHNLRANYENITNDIFIDSLIELSEYAKKCDSGNYWNKKNWIPALLLTNNGVVTSLEMFNNVEITDLQHMAGKLKTLGRQYGSESIVFFPYYKEQFLLCESFAQRTGMVKDIYYESPDESFLRSKFNNGNIFKLTRGDLKVEDSNDYKKDVEEILLSSESVTKTRDSLKINNEKENKLMDNEKKIEPAITEVVNEAEKTVITSEALAEKTTSFVTGNTFSKRNQEKIASLLDTLQIQDKVLDEKAQLVSEEQIMMADISVEDFANNMKNIPFAEITVPDEVDEGEEQTFHEEKYYLLDSLPEFLKEKVLNFKSEIQFNQNLRNAKLIPLNQKNVSEFTDFFRKTLSDTSMPDEIKENISKKIQSSIEGINSDNENIKKQSFKDLRAFVSAAQVIATNLENTSFLNEIQQANSLEAVFDITSRTIHESYEQKRNIVDRSSQSLVETVGREYKMAKLLAPERNRELFDSILYPEGHGYTQEDKENALKNDAFSKLENISMETSITDRTNTKDMSKVIVFDTETTGFKAGDDELLQISIADGNGNTIFNSYVKPENKKSWEKAMEVNGITPEMVKDAPIVKELVPELQKIFDDADMLMSYNGRFDVNFLEAAGVNISKETPHLDVIKPSASITQYPMDGKNDKRSIDGYHYPKLTDIAEHFGIEYKAHDSMGDTLATLQVAKNIYGENLEKVTPEILAKYTIDQKKEKGLSIDNERNNYTMGFIVREKHPEIIQEIKAGEGNEQIKELLSQLEADPKIKNIKAPLNKLLGEYTAKNHRELNDELDNYIKERHEKKSQRKAEKKEKQNKPSYSELESTLSTLKETLEMMQNKMQEVLQQNMELRNEISMIKQEKFGKEAGTKEVNEQGRSDSQTLSETGRTDNTGLVFNRENAFTVDTKIPKFGKFNKETGKIEIINGARFSRLIENEKDNSRNTVELTIFNEDGSNKGIIISEREYNNIINAQEKLLERKAKIGDPEQSSYDWMVAHMQYNESLLLDEYKYRLNTSDNFKHNFRVHCIREAKNPDDAYKIAREMIEDMPPNEKRNFNEMRNAYGKELFDNMLLDIFYKVAKDRDLQPSDLNFDKSTVGNFIDETNKSYIELQNGDKIDESINTKVGDSFKAAINTKGIDGKIKKTPSVEWQVVKATRNLPNNKIMIFNKEKGITYVLPKTEFIKNMQKIERNQRKEKIHQIKLDNKKHQYERNI